MGLDIRLPIGLMFCLLGPILLVAGFVQGEVISTRTGASMTMFGAVMLALGVRGQRRNAAAADET